LTENNSFLSGRYLLSLFLTFSDVFLATIFGNLLGVKKRKYYKVQSEPILGKWQHCQNPQMPIFSPPVLSI
jgi:hypothetical protein